MKDGATLRPTLRTGSLSRRMILIAAAWILVLLAGGGFALDRVLVSAVTQNFDDRQAYVLKSLLVSAGIDSQGEVWFNREPADQGFLEPGSGVYWQVSGKGHDPFPSRSLWDRRLAYGPARNDDDIHVYNSTQFADEKLRIVERDVKLPGSDVRWRFQVAQRTTELDAQIGALRRILIRSFALLGVGLLLMAAMQTFYGLYPLRRVREEIARCVRARPTGFRMPCPTRSRRWSRS